MVQFQQASLELIFIHDSNVDIGAFILLGLVIFYGKLWTFVVLLSGCTFLNCSTKYCSSSTGINFGRAALVMLLFPIIT